MKKLLVRGQAPPEPRLTAGLRDALTSTVGSRVSTWTTITTTSRDTCWRHSASTPAARSFAAGSNPSATPCDRWAGELGPVTRCPEGRRPHAERTH